jgi:hypothetical protein
MGTRTFGANTRLYVAAWGEGLQIYNLAPATGLLLGSAVQSVSGVGTASTLALGPNAVYVGWDQLYRCSLDPVTGLVMKSDGTNFDCKKQGSSSGQFTVGGTAYTPISILFY